MPETFPWWQQALEVLTFPPSLLFGLLTGVLCRRLVVAVVIAGILSPLTNMILATAFSDGPPGPVTVDSLLFGVSGMIAAAVVWLLARAFMRQRRKAGL